MSGKLTFRLVPALRYAAAAMLAAIACGCLLYLWSGYDTLRDWYYSLNPEFYKADQWPVKFFTLRAKQHGNWWCAAGLLAAGLLLFQLLRKKARPAAPGTRPAQPLFETPLRYGIAMLLAALAFVLWRWGMGQLPPAPDETFSALNSAGVHPFQTAAYYMLPNNHILFNLLNNLLFHPAGGKVFTARVISLIAYSATVLVIFRWFCDVMKAAIPAALATLVLATQLMVWGMACQGRGYAMLTLVEWACVLQLFRYLRSGEALHVRWLAALSFVGYALVPTFLFFHAAVLAVLCLKQLYDRRFSRLVWRTQLLAAAAVFLFYLPAICFSGVHSLLSNDYVVAQTAPLRQFTEGFQQVFWYDLEAMFNGYLAVAFDSYLALFFVPALLLFFFRQKEALRTLLVFSMLWTVMVAGSFGLRNNLLPRMLAGQLSFSLAAIACVPWFAATSLNRLLRKGWLPSLLFAPVALWALYYNTRQLPVIVQNELYGPHITNTYNEVKAGLEGLDAKAVTGCSEESFYCYQLLRSAGRPAHLHIRGGERYVVWEEDEKTPKWLLKGYLPLRSFFAYTLYERRPYQ